jgi:hypothetical protein
MTRKRLFSLAIAVMLIVGGVLIVRAEVPPSATAANTNPAPDTGFDPQRAQDADAARWVAMGEFYAKEAQRIQRVQDADDARWAALAEYYKNQQANTHSLNSASSSGFDPLRTQDADAARWTAMAKYYMEQPASTH